MQLEELVMRIVRKTMREMRVSMPARIIGYDAATRRARVQIIGSERLPDGRTVAQPVVTDVPVFMPIGGGAALTMPIGAGDTGIVVFADQDIGGWTIDDEGTGQDSGRRHSLSDAMFIPGDGRSPADADNVVMSYGGATVKITPGGDVNIDAPGNITFTAAGDVTITGATINLN